MERPKRENVMLCYPADEGRVARLGEKFFVQPKLNGERCRVEWFHGEPVLLSSYGNVIKGLEHIQQDLMALATKCGQCEFDGELYVHGMTWSQIVSIVGRTVNRHPDAASMQYHIFDTQNPTAPQVGRLLTLKGGFDKINNEAPALHLVETSVCAQGDQWQACSEFTDQGYEGIIMRDPLALYHRKRNVCIIKYKPTESDEYEIVEVLEAISKEGEPKNMVGAFLVKGDDGTVFKVGAGKMKHPRRTALWQKRQFLTGLLLMVKHEQLRTVNDIPIACVAVDVKGV